MKRFDLLDFVIIDVPATNLPWQERSNQVTQLFKQCKFTQKPMLALGCGMSQLSFYCAMEGKKLSVINGREMGGSLETIKGAVEPSLLEKLKKGYHVFLDNLSGDVFTYQEKSQSW